MGGSYTEAQKNASIKYLSEKTDLIQLRVPKGKKAEYKAQAALHGLSLNAYVVSLLEGDKATVEPVRSSSGEQPD